MFLPTGSDQPIGPMPWMTILLIGLCLALQILSSSDAAAGEKLARFCASPLGEQVSGLLEKPCEVAVVSIIKGQARQQLETSTSIAVADRPHAIRLISRAERELDLHGWSVFDPSHPSVFGFFLSAFHHAGWLHLAGNMLFLWIFGRILEDELGAFGLLGVFMGAHVFANLIYGTTCWIGLIRAAPTLGASAGISGVLAGVYRKLPQVKITVVYFMFTMVRTLKVPAIYMIGAYMLVDVFNLVTGMAGDTNLIAHLSGFGIVFFTMEQWGRDRF